MEYRISFIGNTCIDLIDDDSNVFERHILFDWLYRASTSIPVEDADRFFQATISFLADDDPGIRERAAIFCADGRYSKEAVEAIRPLLNDPVQQVRLSAVTGLGVIGMYSPAPLSILVDALEHEDTQVRVRAAETLGLDAEYIEEPKAVFETLVNVYETDSDVEVRAGALGAICSFESRRERAIEYMREAFWSTESLMREKAIESLTMMEQFDESFELEFALKGLTDESADVRFWAAWIIESRISTDSLRPHEEFFRKLADTGDEELRGLMLLLIKRIQNETED